MDQNIIIAEGDQVNGQDIILLSNPARKRTIESIQHNEVVWCKTQKEAEDFCKLLHAAGKKWRDGESYSELTYSTNYAGNLSYHVTAGEYSSREHYIHYGLISIPANEFIPANEPTIYELVKEIHQKIMISRSSVTYQLCPMCSGLKYVPSMSTTINQQCSICSGKGIIPQHII